MWHESFAVVYSGGIAIFLCFAGTYFCAWDRLVFVAGN